MTSNETESISRWVDLPHEDEAGKKVQFDCPICLQNVPLPGVDMPKFANKEACDAFYQEHPDVEKPILAWCGHMFGHRCYRKYMAEKKRSRLPQNCPMCRISWEFQYPYCHHPMSGLHGPTYEGEDVAMVPPVVKSDAERPLACLSCHCHALKKVIKGVHVMERTIPNGASELKEDVNMDLRLMEKDLENMERAWYEVQTTKNRLQTLMHKHLAWEMIFPDLSSGPRITEVEREASNPCSDKTRQCLNEYISASL